MNAEFDQRQSTGSPADRRASPVGSTADIPAGTILHVPAAPPSGPVPDAPVVAAQTIPWKKSVLIWVGYAMPVIWSVYEYLDSLADDLHDFSWRRVIRIVIVGGMGLIVAYFRKNNNTITR